MEGMFLTLIHKLTLLLVVIIGLFLLSSCDGGIKVKGHVYGQSTSVGDSQAFIDQTHSVGRELSPIEGAKVTLYHAGDYSKEKVERSELRKDSSLTDSNGGFKVGGLTSPFRFNAALVVEKEGYKSMTKIFLHDKLDHEAVIILVPDKSLDGDSN